MIAPGRCVLSLLLSMGVVGCASGGRSAGRLPQPVAAGASTVAVSRASGWLVYAFGAAVVDANAVSSRPYTASYVGAERIERTVQLPEATAVSWSADGRWLALCGPVAGAQVHHARVIRFDGQRVGEPVDLGECSGLSQAPGAPRLLIRTPDAWRGVDLSSEIPRQSGAFKAFAEPIEWSPSATQLLARAAGPGQPLHVVSGLGGQPLVVPLDVQRGRASYCRWGPSELLACIVEGEEPPRSFSLQTIDTRTGSRAVHALTERPASFGWAGPDVLVYELPKGGGVYALRGGVATQLLVPGESDRLEHQALSPVGGWLLDGESGHVRLWDLASAPREVVVPGLSAQLLDPRWSRNGEHALIGVRHAQYRSLPSEVWLVARAAKKPALVRVATATATRWPAAWFSPGSEWVLVTLSDIVVPTAATSPAPAPQQNRAFAVNVASGARFDLPVGWGDWASDDTAFCAVDRERGQLLVVRVQGQQLATPEVLSVLGPGMLHLAWQP